MKRDRRDEAMAGKIDIYSMSRYDLMVLQKRIKRQLDVLGDECDRLDIIKTLAESDYVLSVRELTVPGVYRICVKATVRLLAWDREDHDDAHVYSWGFDEDEHPKWVGLLQAQLAIEELPLPKLEDLRTTLKGAK